MSTLAHRRRLVSSLAAAALLAALPLASPAAAHQTYPGAAHQEAGSAAYAQLPLAFEPNWGQTASQVDYVARGKGYSVAVNATSAVLGLADADVRMQIIGAQAQPALATQELEGKVNYLLGNDPAAWRTDIPTFGRVTYQDVYPGIDLAYYGQQSRLEYDFVVLPGASSTAIRLGFDTVDSLELDAQGDLLLRMPAGTVRQPRPTIYQDINGQHQTVAGGFVMADGQVGFEVGAYDT
jgi:hypothetical protein